jgi:hypothetical protein
VKVFALGLLLALPLLAHAAETQPYAYVTALQPPAWVETKGQRTALTASSPILPGNSYSTGKGGRLQIAMADGSIVKLGENSQFGFPRLQLLQRGKDSVLNGALRISKGTFRYTAQASRFVQKRELDLYLGSSLSIGIGNPDLWGQSNEAQDAICLLRGKVKLRDLKNASSQQLLLEQANSAYIASHSQVDGPVVKASPEQLKAWLSQTELDDSHPSLQSNGAYSVLVAVYLDEAHARGILADINQKGYPAILRAEKRDGTPVFNVLIEGLSNARTAAAYAEELKKPLYLKNPRVVGPVE